MSAVVGVASKIALKLKGKRKKGVSGSDPQTGPWLGERRKLEWRPWPGFSRSWRNHSKNTPQLSPPSKPRALQVTAAGRASFRKELVETVCSHATRIARFDYRPPLLQPPTAKRLASPRWQGRGGWPISASQAPAQGQRAGLDS